MDSDNLQSSSGASEEYDSRAAADSISALLNQPPPQHHTTLSSASVFDPSLYNLDPPSRSPQNLDIILSNDSPRSNMSGIDLRRFVGTGACTLPPQPVLANQPNQNRGDGVFPSGSGDQIPNQNMVRNPRKRSRASRRAPTTVLATDTTNFRAMVQEFTGIPAPPFNSFAFPGSRFPSHFDLSTPPPYLLKPFAQKFQPPPNFQSLLHVQVQVQPPLKYPCLDSAISGTKTHGSLDLPISNEYSVLDGFDSLSHGVQVQGNGRDARGWGSDGGAVGSDGNLLKSVDGNGKLGFSASSLDFDGGKGPENAGGARSEGMVESWIIT